MKKKHVFILYNGTKFYKYFKGSNSITKYYWPTMFWRGRGIDNLHREIWKAHNGPIPKGMCIHHKDGNPENNSIENLEMLSWSEHKKKHYSCSSNEWLDKIRPLAVAWHRTKKARKWCGELSKKRMADRPFVDVKCAQCGKVNKTQMPEYRKFCNSTCRTRHYKCIGKYDEERKCLSCGNIFKIWKYKKQNFCSVKCSKSI